MYIYTNSCILHDIPRPVLYRWHQLQVDNSYNYRYQTTYYENPLATQLATQLIKIMVHIIHGIYVIQVYTLKCKIMCIIIKCTLMKCMMKCILLKCIMKCIPISYLTNAWQQTTVRDWKAHLPPKNSDFCLYLITLLYWPFVALFVA